jgi:osmotically-inducible protein OsmY
VTTGPRRSPIIILHTDMVGERNQMIDTPLDDRVLTALERNPYVGRRSLRFETSAGRVTLKGVVNTYFQKQMAQEALRNVDGVAEIANELEVCWS